MKNERQNWIKIKVKRVFQTAKNEGLVKVIINRSYGFHPTNNELKRNKISTSKEQFTKWTITQ